MEELTAREITARYVNRTLDGNTKWVMIPKKYYLKLDIDLISTKYKYLNYNTRGEFVISSKYENMEFKSEFTMDEIKELKIPMEYFILEEC